ncbi:MAG TPA: tetratricopeptide repeat protein [Verrucomicrobiae bacterium]|nr:tetratricopeptide repeat protein [Verrucomicrobiae bacterium]
MNARKFLPLLFVLAGFCAWHNSFRSPFIFDDRWSIPQNPHIRHLWPISEVFSAPPLATVSGRPTVSLSLALNYALGGYDVRGYHLFNLAAHVLSALVLFGILRRTLEQEKFRGRFGASAIWLAAVIALIWEVHPLQTESVTYIIQRTELLMGLFLLLTMYCFLRGSVSANARGWYIAAVISCALGMGSKEVMVVAPLIVMVYDRIFLVASFRELWQRRRGLYLGLAGTWLLLAVLVLAKSHPATGFGFQRLTPWDYLLTESGVIVYYLQLCLWPRPLVIDYFDWPIATSIDDCLVPVVVVLCLLAATVWAFRRHPWAGFLGAWFFLILAPTSSILPSVGEVAAERRMYLPLAAVVTLAVIGAFEVGRRLLNKQQGVLVGGLASLSVLALFTDLTIQRNRDYRSELSIWQDTVEKRPDNPRAIGYLASAYSQAGNIPQALALFERAIQLNNNVEAHYNLGLTLHRAGRLADAIAQYREALRIMPDYAEAHNNLGFALQQMGRLPEAMEHFHQALRIEPELAVAHFNLANALMLTGKTTDAIAQYQAAVQLEPDYAEAYSELGVALVVAGHRREAMAQFERAMRIKPEYAEPQNNLAWLLATLPPTQGGDPSRAVLLAQHAAAIDRNHAAGDLDTLAVAYAAAGRFSDAVTTAQRAIEQARAAGQTRLVGEIQNRLELYRRGLPYRETASGPKPGTS